MAAEYKIEVVGLKDALRTLNKIDKVARRQVTKDYKQIVAPVVNDIKQHIPLKPIMSGWGYKWTVRGKTDILPWKGNERAMLKPYTSGKKPRTFGAYTSSLGVFGIRWNAPAATLMDLAHTAHKPQASHMIDTLNSRIGSGKSRIMWKNFDRHQRVVEEQMQVLVRRVMKQAQGEL
jgi:hypothetical protein